MILGFADFRSNRLIALDRRIASPVNIAIIIIVNIAVNIIVTI